MPTWPSDLPQELDRQGFQQSAKDNVLRSQVETGPEKTRRRYTAAVEPLRGAMLMTGLQLESLHSFFTNQIQDGALAFDFPDIRKAGTISVRFSQPYSWTNVGGDYWRVSMQFNVQPSGELVTGPTERLFRSYRGVPSALTQAAWVGTYMSLNARALPSREFPYNNVMYRVNEFLAGEHTRETGQLTICSQIQRVGGVPADFSFDAMALASLALRFRLVNGTNTRFEIASARYNHQSRVFAANYYCLTGSADLAFLEQWRMLGSDNEIIVEITNV